ncbi:uncharacterized protein METZ01_LOCUS205443, partial [marine metagenome]
ATTGNITQIGALTIGGTTTLLTSGEGGIIDLGTTSNKFTGALLITTNDNTDGSDGLYEADVTIDGGEIAALVIGTSTIDGDLTLKNGNVSGITDAVGATVTVKGDLKATTDNNSGVINLGDDNRLAVSGKFQLITDGTGDATVVNSTGLNFITAKVGGDFSATATNGAITQDAAFDIDGTTNVYSATEDNIILSKAGNDFSGAVWFRGGGVFIKDKNNIDFGTSNSTATKIYDGYTLKVIAKNNITDSGNLKVTGGGNAYFGTNNEETDNVIVLNSSGNVFEGTLTLEGGIGHLVNSSAAVILEAMILAGDLDVTTTGGTVTDIGVLNVSGLTTITATGFDVTLDGDGVNYNNFGDDVEIAADDVVLKATGDINFGVSTVTGDFEITAGGDVTQSPLPSQQLTINGTGKTIHITGDDIMLNNAANNFVSAVKITTSGSDVELADVGDIILGASTVSGYYKVTAGGTVTQSGALTITGVTTIAAQNTAGTTNYAVTLTEALNDFTGAVGVTGATVRLTDTNDLVLGDTTTTGAYTVIAGGGITDSGALTIGTT